MNVMLLVEEIQAFASMRYDDGGEVGIHDLREALQYCEAEDDSWDRHGIVDNWIRILDDARQCWNWKGQKGAFPVAADAVSDGGLRSAFLDPGFLKLRVRRRKERFLSAQSAADLVQTLRGNYQRLIHRTSRLHIADRYCLDNVVTTSGSVDRQHRLVSFLQLFSRQLFSQAKVAQVPLSIYASVKDGWDPEVHTSVERDLAKMCRWKSIRIHLHTTRDTAPHPRCLVFEAKGFLPGIFLDQGVEFDHRTTGRAVFCEDMTYELDLWRRASRDDLVG